VSRPRLLLVGRTRYRLPLDESLARKFDALDRVLELRVLGSAAAGAPSGNGTFRLVPRFLPESLDGVAFHTALPFRIAREIRDFRPDAVLVQGAHEATAALLGRRLAGSHVPVALDVHGDWRTATRLYGSPARRLLNPVADWIAAFGVRNADAVRTVSDFTTGLVRAEGVEPAAVFPAFMDLDPFLGPTVPLPERPAALFVGVLELYKNVEGLAQAWRRVAPRIPEAELRIVGRGPRGQIVEALVRDLPEQTTWQTQLSPAGVAAELDRATFLVLPSRREGMGRVVVEAFCRGRAVLGTHAGGIPDLVVDGENGLLVSPGDTQALADALERLSTDRQLAERLAFGARASAEGWIATPEEYASRLLEFVERGCTAR
jgi:glycosyltransferase involved in cell wall biosynthesis